MRSDLSALPPRGAEKILRTAAEMLLAVDGGEVTLDDVFDEAPAEFRRTLEHLLLNCFRHRKFLEAQISSLCSRAPAPPVKALLLLLLCQCRFQSAIPAESAVNVAVDCAKKYHAGGFVNALARRLLERNAPLPEAPEDILPTAILRRWKRRFGAPAMAELAKLYQSEAEFTFRLLPGAEMPEKCEEREGFGGFRFASGSGSAILHAPEFAAGNYYIQDPAASFAVSLALEVLPRARQILDLCAAPGGKTLMLAEKMVPGSRLVAADISARRQKRTEENLIRRGYSVEIVTAAPSELYGQYDLILADVPCSNSGVFRRRPDALWRFSENELKRVSLLQKRILTEAVRLLASGGTLIVSSCSIEPEENDGLTAWLTGKFPELVCEAGRTLLPEARHDGAFAARLHK